MWELLKSSEWPGWVVRRMTKDVLHEAWEHDRRVVLYGKTFEYRVVPMVISQGHWGIARMERRRRVPRK